MPRKSWVWDHFNKGDGCATCKECGKIISTPDSSTKTLARHISRFHDHLQVQGTVSPEQPALKRQKTIIDFGKEKEALDRHFAYMVISSHLRIGRYFVYILLFYYYAF